jgi:Tachylectin
MSRVWGFEFSKIRFYLAWLCVLGSVAFVFKSHIAGAQGSFGSDPWGGSPAFIYGISQDGSLKWFRHNGSPRGQNFDVPNAWEGPKTVGTGWQEPKQVFSSGNGIIYAIFNDGTLKWYKHNGYKTGEGVNVAGAWEGPKTVGTGWQAFNSVFALLPSTPSPLH